MNTLSEQAKKYAQEFCDPAMADTRAQIVVAMRMKGQTALADALEEAVVVSRAYLALEQQAPKWVAVAKVSRIVAALDGGATLSSTNIRLLDTADELPDGAILYAPPSPPSEGTT